MTEAHSPEFLGHIQKLVDQYHHRLLSLEFELKDMARSKGVSTKDYQQRHQAIKALEQDLVRLKALSLPSDTIKNEVIDIGLPILEDYTPEEAQVCQKFLAEKDALVARSQKELVEVYGWIKEIVQGYSGFFNVLRLSKLRSKLASLEKVQLRLDFETSSLDLAIDKLGISLGKPKLRERWKNVIEGLTTLFNSIDQSTTRIAKLKSATKKEEIRIAEMENWLDQSFKQLTNNRPSFAPPTPLMTDKAQSLVEGMLGINNHRDKKSLTVAKNFLDEFSFEGALPQNTLKNKKETMVDVS